MTGRFPRELIVAPAAGTVPERVGERCEGREEGKWYKAKIIGAKDGKFQVTWPGWDKTHDSWLALAQLRAYEPKTLADGATVEIEWGGKWYPGKVVRSELGLLLVHYDGYTAADHEWVPMARVRAPK